MASGYHIARARLEGKDRGRNQPGEVGEGLAGDNGQREQSSLGCRPALLRYRRSRWSESCCAAPFSRSGFPPPRLDVCIRISVLV